MLNVPFAIPRGVAATPSNESIFGGELSKNVGGIFQIPVYSALSIGFRLTAPPGGRVIFEGSWDNSNWIDITLRQMGAHGYSTTTSEDEAWIGSVATFMYFRVRTVATGTSNGYITGKLTAAPCTIEGIEHGFMPHRIGATAVAKPFSFSAITSNGTIWAPVDPTHKIVVTDLHFTVTDTTTKISFCDGSYAEDKHMFVGQFKPGNASSVYVPISFTLPHVFSGTGRCLTFTQTAAAPVDGVVHGYECEG